MGAEGLIEFNYHYQAIADYPLPSLTPLFRALLPSKEGYYSFEGILPESATFDAKSNYLAVAVYDYFTLKPEGGVEIWQVVREPSLALQHTRQRIDVDRGIHQVVVAP